MSRQPLLASPRHTAVFLAIAAVVTLAGLAQSREAHPTASPGSHAVLYLVLIGVQLLWLRFVRAGLRKQGLSPTLFLGAPPATAAVVLGDLPFGALGYGAAHAAAEAVKSALGDPPANVAFLLPHGAVESALWVLLSMTVGVVEETVFRGYLQRQLAALTHSVGLGIVLQALVFGILHGYQGLGSIAVTGAYGLVLGLLAWWRGNVRAGILAHAATDIVGGLLPS